MPGFGSGRPPLAGTFHVELRSAMAESITCPRCKRTSHHPRDIEQGYCGFCHWWTSDTIGILNMPSVMAEMERIGMLTPLPAEGA